MIATVGPLISNFYEWSPCPLHVQLQCKCE